MFRRKKDAEELSCGFEDYQTSYNNPGVSDDQYQPGSGYTQNQKDITEDDDIEMTAEEHTISEFESFNFIVECLAADAQLFGCCGQVTVILPDSRFNGLAFHFFQVGDYCR